MKPEAKTRIEDIQERLSVANPPEMVYWTHAKSDIEYLLTICEELLATLNQYDEAVVTLTDQQLYDNPLIMTAVIKGRAAIKSAERINAADELPPEFRDGTLKTKKETKWRAWRTDREDGISGTGETETEAIMALAEQYRQIEEDGA